MPPTLPSLPLLREGDIELEERARRAPRSTGDGDLYNCLFPSPDERMIRLGTRGGASEGSFMPAEQSESFQFVMIKPSHYDDDGYPIQWLKSDIPANTLAAVNGLAIDCQRRQVLGPDVELRFSTYDETNIRIRPRKIAAAIRRLGGRALIGFIGVQSNQFGRAVDLARAFLAEGLPVAIGGFHVAGCISMLK